MYVFFYKEKSDNDIMYIVTIVVMSLFLCCCKIVYQYKKQKYTLCLIEYFDIKYSIMAFMFAVVGCLFFFMKQDYYSYWCLHSLWHIFIALALFSKFKMYKDNSNFIINISNNIDDNIDIPIDIY